MEDVLKRSNSHIYRALLKNGYSNFSLTILEYCDKEKCIEREDFYLSCLPHEYNILQKAGSVLGSTRNNTGENNPFFW
jgi:group I intron endonuclease